MIGAMLVLENDSHKLANKLWEMKSKQPLPTTYGIVGCGLAMYTKENGKPDTELNRLFGITMPESAYLIWKLRCERRIAREVVLHSEREVDNR